MRKLKILEHISLDGVISPGGPGEYGDDYANGGWTAPYRGPAGAAAVAEAQGTGFDLLLGRRTYDLWAGFWPKVKGGPFADGLNAARKYVATHRPGSLGWGPVGDLGTDVMAGGRRPVLKVPLLHVASVRVPPTSVSPPHHPHSDPYRCDTSAYHVWGCHSYF